MSVDVKTLSFDYYDEKIRNFKVADKEISKLKKCDSSKCAWVLDYKEELRILFGKEFGSFVEDCDLEHPDLNSVFNLLTNSWVKTFVSDIARLMRHIKENNYNPDIVADFVYKEDSGNGRILKEYTQACLNKENPKALEIYSAFKLRCIKNNELRNAKRLEGFSSKRTNVVTDNIAKSHIGFDCYIRGVQISDSALADFEKKKTLYKEYGLLGAAEHINSALNAIKSEIEDTFIGFKKMTVAKAVGLLGGLYDLAISEDGIPKIKMTDTNRAEYTPWIFDINSLREALPKSVFECINYLDALPEYLDKALFDRFIAVVPLNRGISETKYATHMKSLNRKVAILGERDKSCYFIGLSDFA